MNIAEIGASLNDQPANLMLGEESSPFMAKQKISRSPKRKARIAPIPAHPVPQSIFETAEDQRRAAAHDIQARLLKRQIKLSSQPGVLMNTINAGEVINFSMDELQNADPAYVRDEDIAEATGMDLSQNMNQVKFLFEKHKADLKRVVSNIDTRVAEIFDRQPVEEDLVPGIVYGYKVRLTDRNPPLRVSITYPGKAANELAFAYASMDVKEPTQAKCMSMHQDNSKIVVQGNMNQKTQKMCFNKQFLYISIIVESKKIQRVRLVARFHEDVRRSVQNIPGQLDEDGQPIVARRDDEIQEIDIDDFHLGQGTLKDKQDRVLRLVSKMKEDELMREKFSKKLEAIR